MITVCFKILILSLPRLENYATALVRIKMMLLVNAKPRQITVMRESQLSKHKHET